VSPSPGAPSGAAFCWMRFHDASGLAVPSNTCPAACDTPGYGGGEGTAGPGAAVTRSANWHTPLAGPRAVALRALLRGRYAGSLGLGAAPRTSAASVTFRRWIRASWWIECIPVPSINRGTRINHDNRRTPPPGVTPVACCDGSRLTQSQIVARLRAQLAEVDVGHGSSHPRYLHGMTGAPIGLGRGARRHRTVEDMGTGTADRPLVAEVDKGRDLVERAADQGRARRHGRPGPGRPAGGRRPRGRRSYHCRRPGSRAHDHHR